MQALNEAKKCVRNMTNIELISYFRDKGFAEEANELDVYCEFPSQEEEKPFEHPYFWAGYILQGGIY